MPLSTSHLAFLLPKFLSPRLCLPFSFLNSSLYISSRLSPSSIPLSTSLFAFLLPQFLSLHLISPFSFLNSSLHVFVCLSPSSIPLSTSHLAFLLPQFLSPRLCLPFSFLIPFSMSLFAFLLPHSFVSTSKGLKPGKLISKQHIGRCWFNSLNKSKLCTDD